MEKKRKATKRSKPKKKADPLTTSFLKKKKLVLVKKIHQGRRSAVYQVRSEKSGKNLILKVAKEGKSSLPMRNQKLWSNQVAPKVPQDAPFVIPKVRGFGFVDKQFPYLLLDYVEGKPFAQMEGAVAKIKVADPKPYLEKVAAMIWFLQKTKVRGLKGVDARLGKSPKTGKLAILENAISSARNYTPHLADLLQIINHNYKNLGKATNHCDVTAINLMVSGDKVALVDADLAGSKRFRFYDVAEFYNRLYTRCCRPDLARYFLKIFVGRLREDQIENFLNNFLCLCALRAIANFGEIESLDKVKGAVRRRFATKFARDVIQYNLVNL